MRLLPAARTALATVIVCTASAGCAAARATSAVRAAGPAAVMVGRVPGASPALTQTGGRTYLSWDLPAAPPLPDGRSPRTPSAGGPPGAVLARIDTRTGKIAATNTFSQGHLGVPLAADGSVWVTVSGPHGELLLRLDPATLMVTGELALSAARYPGGAHLAYAGGWLWADGGGRLLRVSPSSVEPTAAIPLGGRSSDVAASPDGSVLIVTEQGSDAAVQRRDPRTGALLAASPVAGADAAVIDGFTGSGVWVTEITGLSGVARRLSLRSLKPAAATRPVSGADDVRVRVAHGLLWVTGGTVTGGTVTGGTAGGTARGYCADARTGRALAALPVTGHGVLLAVGVGVLYYARPAPHGTGTRIVPVPVPAGCG